MKDAGRLVMALIMTVFLSHDLRAQQAVTVRMLVTYVTPAQVYFDAGKEQGLSIGDTVIVGRASSRLGSAVIAALASHSSVGRIVTADSTLRAGDWGTTTTFSKSTALPEGSADTLLRAVLPPNPPSTPTVPPEHPKEPNRVSGRIAAQFSGVITDDSRLNVSEPSLYAWLTVQDLLGTGARLSFSGRQYYDMTDNYMRYGNATRARLDVYGLQVELDRPGDFGGFTLGRTVSRYVNSLGLFDGGQLFARAGGFTAGALLGKGVEGRVLSGNGQQVKSAVFAGFRSGDDPFRNYEASVAYARQTIHGNLDRAFVAVQNSLFLGPEFSASGNAAFDLYEMRNGQQTGTFKLSDAYLFLNYYPYRWLSASAGYDGTRSVYLFETMKGIPDSLFRESLRHGFRTSLTARIGHGISATFAASYRGRQDERSDSRTLTGSVRFADILTTGINGSVRYSDLTGVDMKGNNSTFELDMVLFEPLDVILRYDSYAYSVAPLKQSYLTETYSAAFSCPISRNLYGSASGDYVVDKTMNSIQIFIELGIWL